MPIVFAHLAVRLHPAHEPLVIHEILHKRLRAALQRVARTGLECRRREVPITQANSAIWLHYGASLLGAGILTGLAAFRYASLAIIMLTILVRGSMFPLSRKQALGARKMQELQPEIRKIMDKQIGRAHV